MAYLRIQLDLRADQDQVLEKHEAWGAITILLIKPDAAIVLFKWEAYLLRFAEWFVKHQYDLCHETLPSRVGYSPRSGESIAATIARYELEQYPAGGEVEEDVYQWFVTDLFKYKRAHSLRSALDGHRVPPIYIGCNGGAGEISLNTQEGGDEDGKWWDPTYNADWAYEFDMSDFCEHLRYTLWRYLESWREAYNDQRVNELANKLLGELNSSHMNGCCHKVES